MLKRLKLLTTDTRIFCHLDIVSMTFCPSATLTTFVCGVFSSKCIYLRSFVFFRAPPTLSILCISCYWPRAQFTRTLSQKSWQIQSSRKSFFWFASCSFVFFSNGMTGILFLFFSSIYHYTSWQNALKTDTTRTNDLKAVVFNVHFKCFSGSFRLCGKLSVNLCGKLYGFPVWYISHHFSLWWRLHLLVSALTAHILSYEPLILFFFFFLLCIQFVLTWFAFKNRLSSCPVNDRHSNITSHQWPASFLCDHSHCHKTGENMKPSHL